MIAEDIEFQISQYADGTLSAIERASVDDLLKIDPTARQMLAEYRRLNLHLNQLERAPVVRWEQFAEHLSDAVDGSQPGVAGRIGWANSWSGRLRIAAAVLIAVTIGVIVNRGRHPAVMNPITAVSGAADVTGPVAEAAVGQSSEDVSIGPSRLAANDGTSSYADAGVVRGPSRVVISEAINMPKSHGKSQPH